MTSITNDYIMNLNYSDETDEAKTPKSIILGSNGVFAKLNGPFFESITRIDNESTNSEFSKILIGSNLPKVETKYEIVEKLPKIPYDAIKALLHFYRWTYNTRETEAQVNFYWNKNHVELPDIPGVTDWGNDVISYTPIQKNSAGLTSAGDDPKYHWFRENMVPYIETHSHHTMNAFMSETDRSNSHCDGFQLVFGHITRPQIAMDNWVTNVSEITEGMNDEFVLKLVDFKKDVFETYKNNEIYKTKKVINLENFTTDHSGENNEFPEDWKNQQVEEKEPIRLDDDFDFEDPDRDTVPSYINDKFLKIRAEKYLPDEDVDLTKQSTSRSSRFNRFFHLKDVQDHVTNKQI